MEKSDEDQKTSVAVYHGVDGNPLETKLVEGITQFQVIVQWPKNETLLLKKKWNLLYTKPT